MKKIFMILDNGYKPDVRVEKEIKTLIKLGFKIFLFCWDQDTDLPESESRDNLVIQRIKVPAGNQEGITKIKKLLKFYYRLIRRVEKLKISFDYIYVHDFLLLPIGVFLKLKSRKQLIYDAHEIYHLMEWEKYNSIVRKLIFIVERIGVKFTDHFIVVSEIRKEFYSAYIKKNIFVLGNWFETYDGPQKELRREEKIPNESLVFGYFGTLNIKTRNLDKLIVWTKKNKNAHLVIAGTGSDKNQMVNLTKNEDRIHYLGWKPNIRQYLNQVDYICYFLDKKKVYFDYAAPNTIYLSMSHDIPFITNVAGEPKALIEKYNIGYYIENENDEGFSKINLDKSTVEYQTKISNIRKVKENFNWNKSINIYKQIFQIQ